MDIAAWLRQLGLERYEQAFRENEIDAEILPKLTADDLNDIGVSAVGHRRKLLEAIAALSAASAPEAHDDAAHGTQPRPPLDVAGPSEAERRQLTVLFCDLVGSTELASRLDPEDMGALMRAYHAACQDVVIRWGGHVAKFMGDGVLVYFGYPYAHEDDAERAVRAGIDLAAAIEGLKTHNDASLAGRIGIATGLVMVGELIGEGAAQEHTVVGDTPNLAARLQALADPGTVVVAANTRRLLGGLFELEDQGKQRLKGFAESVRTFRVVRESQSESRFEALHGRHLTPLVGREHEIGLLLDRWERAKDDEGQVVLLSGEPGIGKSRIVRALRERLEDKPYTPLSHYCSPFHVNSALHPVIALLERSAGFARDDGADEKLAKLEALLALGTDQPGEAVALVAPLLGVPTGERYPPLDLTPQRQRQRTLEVLVDQVEGLARREPVLAIYEDVHWVDPTTLELLDLVVARVRHVRVLILMTFRPEFDPPWVGTAHVSQLPLNRLGRREGAAIVERLTSGKAFPNEILEQIVAKTDGIPLFVEELTKTVLETDLLHDAGGHYELAGPLPPLAIPATLHDSLMARLDRLAPAKQAAQIGAVIGREFSHELLAAVAPLSETELAAALDQLIRAELIFGRGMPPNAIYSFKHALVQDAAYHSLLKAKRQELHSAVATALERLPQVVETEPEVVAHHLAEAGFAERAIMYWAQAARRALSRSAELEAIEHLQRALGQLAAVPEREPREQLEFELSGALGRALSTVRGFTAAETGHAFEHAAELGRRLGVGARLFPVLWGLFIFHHAGGRLEAGDRIAWEFLHLAERHKDTGQVLTAERVVANSEAWFGRFTSSRSHAERALSLYDPRQHQELAIDYAYDQRVVARDILMVVLFALGYPRQAETQIRQATAEARSLNHRASLAHALTLECYYCHWTGTAAAVLERAAEVERLAHEQAIPVWLGLATVLKGWAISRQAAEKGVAEASRGLEMLDAIGVRVFRPYLLGVLADAETSTQQHERALVHLDEATREASQSGDRWYEAELLRRKGELLNALPEPALKGAEESLRMAIEVAREQEAKMWELRAAISLARLWAEQGERQKAHELLAPVYGWFTEGFDTQDLKNAKALLDALA